MQRVRAPKPPNPRATHQLVARRQAAGTRSRRDVSAMRMTIAAAITSEEVIRVEDRVISLGDNLGSESYTKEPRKIRLLMAYPSFRVIDRASPPVSPSVVARILTIQN